MEVDLGGGSPAWRHAANIIKQGWDLGRVRVMGWVGDMFGKNNLGGWGGCVWKIILHLSYLRLHANSTDKIEIEQHCTLLLSKYKIQSEAQNQSGLDIHQVHPEQKKSTPSSRIGHHSWLGRSKKGSQNSRVQLPPVLRCGPDQGVATCSSTSRHHLSKVLHH